MKPEEESITDLTNITLHPNVWYHFNQKSIDQLIKNQEDAEKYREFPDIVILTLEYKEIVERLKKYEKEMREHNGDYDYGTKAVANDIQKILGEKK